MTSYSPLLGGLRSPKPPISSRPPASMLGGLRPPKPPISSRPLPRPPRICWFSTYPGLLRQPACTFLLLQFCTFLLTPIEKFPSNFPFGGGPLTLHRLDNSTEIYNLVQGKTVSARFCPLENPQVHVCLAPVWKFPRNFLTGET